jgi:hypothetical protein
MIRLKWTLKDWPGERGYEKALRESVTFGLEVLKDKVLPIRFTWAGAYRYHFRPRGAKYLKSKKKHNQPPFVLSGDTRAKALAGAQIRVQIGGKKNTHLKVTFPVPDYIMHRKPSPTGRPPLDAKRELQSLVEADVEMILPHIDARMEMCINYRRQTNARAWAGMQRRAARAGLMGAD